LGERRKRAWKEGMTVLAELPTEIFPNLKAMQNIDVFGVNAYTYADSVGRHWSEQMVKYDMDKPYIQLVRGTR
jgi:hypothetical protein